jgi:hypothetical protein
MMIDPLPAKSSTRRSQRDEMGIHPRATKDRTKSELKRHVAEVRMSRSSAFYLLASAFRDIDDGSRFRISVKLELAKPRNGGRDMNPCGADARLP